MAAPVVSITQPGAIEQAARLLRAGELVVFPTDTVYGVGAFGLSDVAVSKLFTAKVRPPHKAIPLLLSDASDVDMVGENFSSLAVALMARYWPGPLTLVVAARPGLPPSLTAGEPTVAVRVPDLAATRLLIRLVGVPVAATSANVSGQSPALTAAEAAEALGDRVALILDGGPAALGEASLVLDVTTDPPRILRPGGLSHDPWLGSVLRRS